jgi:hypothetical protein
MEDSCPDSRHLTLEKASLILETCMKSLLTLTDWRPRLCRPVLAAVCLAAVTFVSAPAQGDLIISAQAVTVAAGSTGDSLDVTLQNTGPSAVTIGGFFFEIIATSSAIDFTSATTNVASYIFSGDSLFGPTISTKTGQLLDASDLSLSGSGTTVASNSTVGLGHVFFDASSSASGSIAVSFTPFPATSLFDEFGNNVSITTLKDGTISIPGTATPAPSTLVMSSILFGMFGAVWSYKRLK